MNKLKAIGMFICIALTAAVVCAAAAFATGCDKEPKESKYRLPKNCDIVLEEKGYVPVNTFIGVCDSYDEIREALMSHGLKSWDNDKVREYAEEHAEDKSFVVCLYGESGDGGQQRLREVEVNDGKLTMYIWCERRGDVSCVIINRLFIAGVDKSFVANVTECEYVFV